MADPIVPFRHRLVNGSTGDPILQVDLPSLARSILVDCGFAPGLSRDDIHGTTDVLVSHMHVDHWIGFDAIIRMNYGEAKTIRVVGPPDAAARVGAKLAGYTWNLDAPEILTFEVIEVHPDGHRLQGFASDRGFAPGPVRWRPPGDVVLDLDAVRVRHALLDHHVPTVAYALEEPPRRNLDGEALASMDLRGGPWCRLLKDVVSLTPDLETLDGHLEIEPGHVRALHELADRLVTVREGHKVAYVTDCGGTPENLERIATLIEGADRLYIEAFYLDEDRDLGLRHMHLTGVQAAELARDAGVDDLVLMHFSKRYSETLQDRIIDEAREVFPGARAFLPRGRRRRREKRRRETEGS